MNKIISTLIIAITVMALTSCNSGHSSKQDEVTTSEKQDSIRQANAEADSIKKAQEEQARLEADSMKKVQEEQARLEAEREAKKWKGATSRSDLKSKLNGTITSHSQMVVPYGGSVRTRSMLLSGISFMKPRQSPR